MPRYDLESRYLIELLSCALHHRKVSAPQGEFSFEDFLKLISSHRIGALIYSAIQENKALFPESFFHAVQAQARREQLRDAMQQDAIEEFCTALEENGIRYLLLKGTVLKRYYEKSYLRMMGDIDVLIDEEHRARVREIMESLGYRTDLYGVHYDDVYLRDPILNFEVHVRLGAEKDNRLKHFQGIIDRAISDPAQPCRLAMSFEDYYLYFILHAEKHCRKNGTGIRTLVDLFVLWNSDFPMPSREAMEPLLKDCGVLQFESELVRLMRVWFDGEKGDAFHDAMRGFLIYNAGLYGTHTNAFYIRSLERDTHSAQASKRKIFLRRAFLPLAEMKERYPILKRCPILLPFCWICRLFQILFQPAKWKQEAHLYRRVSKQMDTQEMIRTRLGFLSDPNSEQTEQK